MQSRSAALARLALQAAGGALQHEAAPAAIQAAAALPLGLRHMASGGSAHPETPLSKIMPPLVALPRQVVNTAVGLTGKLLHAAATSGAVKGAVAKFADDVLLKEQFLKLSEVDVAYWTYWLSTSGYSSQAGYKQLADAAVGRLPSLEPQQVTDLVVGFHKAGYYDKTLFNAVGSNISANFTKFETDQLFKILSALHDFGHYNETVFDDIADSITYCNSYLAPIKAPTSEVAKALAAYAKFDHERADLFVTLARGISELGLSKLSAEDRKTAVTSALSALHKFKFYPEQVDALLYFTHAEPELFSADQAKLASDVRAAVEAQTGGKLSVYTPNDDEDAAHWYAHHTGHGPTHHELYAFREALVPKSYSPAAFRHQA